MEKNILSEAILEHALRVLRFARHEPHFLGDDKPPAEVYADEVSGFVIGRLTASDSSQIVTITRKGAAVFRAVRPADASEWLYPAPATFDWREAFMAVSEPTEPHHD